MTPYTRDVNTARNKEINLVPKTGLDKTLGGRIIKWAIQIGRYIIIFTELVAVACFLFRFKLDLEHKELNQIIKSKKETVIAYADFEKEFLNTQKRVEEIENLHSNYLHLSLLPQEVAKVTPKDIVFTDLQKKADTIIINGYSFSTQGLKIFLEGLKQQEQFKEISLENITSGGKKDPKINFIININLESKNLKE